MTAQSPEEIYDFLTKLFNDREYRKIADYFEPDAIIVPPHHQPPVNAREALKNYQFIFDRHSNYTVSLKINHVETTDTDAAKVSYSWMGVGDMGIYAFDGVDEVRCQADGSWLITSNHAFHTPRYDENNKAIEI